MLTNQMLKVRRERIRCLGWGLNHRKVEVVFRKEAHINLFGQKLDRLVMSP